MKKACCTVALVVGALLAPALDRAQAQVVIEPVQEVDNHPTPIRVPIACGQESGPLASLGDPIADIEKAYKAADWKSVTHAARCILGGATEPAPAFTLGKDSVFLTWIGSDTFGDSVLRRVLVGPTVEPWSLDLPGIGPAAPERLFEALLSHHPGSRLVSAYTSTEEANPLLTEIPDVFAKILPVFYPLAVGFRLSPSGTVNKGKLRPPAPPVYLTVYAVPLPVRRASVSVKSAASEPRTVDAFVAGVGEIADGLGGQVSKCGRELAGEINRAILEAMQPGQDMSRTCSSDSTRGECLDLLDEQLRAALLKQGKQPGCAASGEAKSMAIVDAAFRAALPAMFAVKVKSEASFRNAPLTHYSFGVVEAVVAHKWVHGQRVKLNDDNVFKPDPLPIAMTIVTLNWSPGGYNPGTIAPSHAEQHRWFVGAVIAPDFGLAFGRAFTPIRGLSVNVGGVVLATRKLGKGEALEAGPNNADSPFGIGYITAIFVGAGYSFK